MVLEMKELAVQKVPQAATVTTSQEDFVDFTYNYRGVLHNSKFKVVRQGAVTNRHKLITVHSIGLNAFSNFGPLLNCEFMEPVATNYCVYHIILPGQDDNAKLLGDRFVYPSMDHLAEAIPKVLQQLNLKSAVFLGDGAGSNILTRFAVSNPMMVDGLILVNPIVDVVGNFSWLGEKIANFNTPVSDQIMNYKFSPIETAQRPELFESHRRHMVNVMNMQNVAQLFAEYERRTDIPVYRPYDPKLFNQTTLRCETLVMVGDLSPFLDSSVEVNSRLNPQKTTFLKMADAGGMLLEEELFKVSEAVVLFLQGLGHIASTPLPRASLMKNSASMEVIQEHAGLTAVGQQFSGAYVTELNSV